MSVGSRLKDERLRLGYSQAAFAELAAASKNTQINWEKDASSPPASALVAFTAVGADALYILTGERAGAPSRNEKAVNYERTLDELEDKLERDAIGLIDLKDDVAADLRQQLVSIATSKMVQVGASYRERADDLLRNHFADESAAKRRQRRFAERSRLAGRAAGQLEDIIRGLDLYLPSAVETEIVKLMLNYSINPNDLFPIFGELRKARDASDALPLEPAR